MDYYNERLALISLEYNNGDQLIGPGLRAALAGGNRFEAWYKIRYFSNGDLLAGIAKRRYLEATLFGLFNSDSPSDTDAGEVIDAFLEPTHFNRIQVLNSLPLPRLEESIAE